MSVHTHLDIYLLMEYGVMDRMSVATAPTLAASEAPLLR